jgi:HAD superfamily hydrolase (TIGR01509 family)
MSQATRGRPLTGRSKTDVRPTVLLDLYGTLVEPDWAALLTGRTALAERAGLAAATAHRAWERTHTARMTGAYGPLADDLAAIFHVASDGTWSATSARLLSQLADEERENWSRGVRLYPDAVPALGLLRSSGSRLAIVTNASIEAASVVDALGLRPLVDDIFASCEAHLLKPDLLGLALHRLGANASDATLVDDDPVQLDGAARLGLGTILIQRSGAKAWAGATSGGHHPVSDLRRVADLVVRAKPARPR